MLRRPHVRLSRQSHFTNIDSLRVGQSTLTPAILEIARPKFSNSNLQLKR